ncbi:MAG: hypothetical protein ACYCS0_00995 [bacterium]
MADIANGALIFIFAAAFIYAVYIAIKITTGKMKVVVRPTSPDNNNFHNNEFDFYGNVFSNNPINMQAGLDRLHNDD